MKHAARQVILLVLVTAIGIASLMTACSSDGSPDLSANSPDPSSVQTVSAYNVPESRYLPEIPRIGIHELKQKLDAGANIAIVDSRDKKYYTNGYIAGAISLPLDNMEAPYPELDGYDEIVTYCT